MSAWSPATTSKAYSDSQARTNAMDVRGVNKEESGLQLPWETDNLARNLVLTLPALDWTIEVDIAGVHRITVHFKGMDISLDS